MSVCTVCVSDREKRDIYSKMMKIPKTYMKYDDYDDDGNRFAFEEKK